MGDLAHDGGWIKRIAPAANAFYFALPLIPDSDVLKTRLKPLWDWIQNE